MFKKVLLIMTLVFCSITQMFSIYRSPEGGRLYYWMMSPDLLSLSMGFTGTEKPSGFVINPASSAFTQNVKIEASYGIAPGLFSQSGVLVQDGGDIFLPFAVQGGVTVPSRFGNFSGYLSYYNMSNQAFGDAHTDDFNIGKTGSFYLGFAKDYNDNFSFGFSGNVKFSYNPLVTGEKFDIGAGMDFSLIFRPEWVVPFSQKNLNWGLQDIEFAVLLKELGKPLTNYPQDENSLAWMPAPFTPAFGITFNLFNNGSTYWKILSDFSSPFFQNMVLSFGTELQLFSFIVLRAGYTFDLEGTLEATGAIPQAGDMYSPYNFAGGISFKFSSDSFKKVTKEDAMAKKHLTTEFSVDLGVRPYNNGMVFQIGGVVQIGVRDLNPPEISYSVSNVYASPNFDGVQDTIELALEIKDERYIRSWYLEIYNSKGDVIRKIESVDERTETLDFLAITKKYFAPKKGVPIPSKVIWDGRNDAGSIIEDGEYTFKFFAMDDNKNINLDGSEKGKIYINTKKPEVKTEIKNKIFSPGSGGTKDNLIIDLDIIRGNVLSVIEPIESEIELGLSKYEIQELSPVNNNVVEQKWVVEISTAAGKIVKTFSYDTKGKKKIEWNGTDETGSKVPDGVYSIKLYSTDLAGNYFEELISNIIIDTQVKPIEVTIDKNIFSPNDDSVKDTVDFSFTIPVKEGIDKWTLDIIDSSSKIFKTFSGEKNPPKNITWNGRNETGIVGKEGEYKAVLNVHYNNGTTSKGTTPDFAIDVTPPSAQVVDFTKAFSPNGDGKIDEAIIKQKSSIEEEWKGVVYNKDAIPVKQFLWKYSVPEKLIWDGKSDKGELLSDGNYYYIVSATDRAGNSFATKQHEIKIDTQDVPLFMTFAHSFFGPTGNGVKDVQQFAVRIKDDANKDVSDWSFSVLNDRENIVYSSNGKGSIPATFIWDGKDKTNKVTLDGNFYGSLTVNFNSGVVSTTRTGFFTMDTKKPEITIQAIKNVFSPNNDGSLDTFEVLQKGSKELTWNSVIYDSAKKVIWKKSISESIPEQRVSWNGKDVNGNNLPNGVYSYVITGIDAAGNSAEASIDSFELKSIHTPAFITIDQIAFSPNKDNIVDNITINPYVTVTDDIEAYSIKINDASGKTVTSFDGTKNIPSVIQWDGLLKDNTIAKDGAYTAQLSVLYRFGNMPIVDSTPFILDTTAPIINVTYAPEFFSPDNDGVDDQLTISIDASDITGIEEWKMTIINPLNKKEFISFTGKGKPAEKINWNGIGKNGDVVESAEDYPVKFYAIDSVGNSIEKDLNPINVDILVIRLADGRLQIKISNIEFLPNLALMTDSSKNVRILQMLGRALKKYNNYAITIEGHANKFAEGLDESKAKSLSEERSKTIALKLKALGINMNRMTTIGKGFDAPLVPFAPGVDKDELAKNRRVEFYLNK